MAAADRAQALLLRIARRVTADRARLFEERRDLEARKARLAEAKEALAARRRDLSVREAPSPSFFFP